MDLSIQEFNFNKTLRENKRATKEKLYQELILEIKKMMVALQKGKKEYVAQLNCFKLITVDEAYEIVEKVYALNGELKNYVRVVFETEDPVEINFYRPNLGKKSVNTKTSYQGLPLKRLTILLEAK